MTALTYMVVVITNVMAKALAFEIRWRRGALKYSGGDHKRHGGGTTHIFIRNPMTAALTNNNKQFVIAFL